MNQKNPEKESEKEPRGHEGSRRAGAAWAQKGTVAAGGGDFTGEWIR